MTDGGDATEAFEAVVASVPTPFYVVTTAAGGERAGCLVGYASRCSIEPPRFAVWLSKVNHTYRVAVGAGTLVVHVLRTGDDELAARFGGETGDDVDKFAGVDWEPGPDGCPVLGGLDWFAGAIVDRVDTAIASSKSEGESRSGRNPTPPPSMRCVPGSPPARTADSAGSTTTRRSAG